MSLSAALVLAAAAAAPVQAPVHQGGPPRGGALAQASVTVQILPSAAVRQASGFQPGNATDPRPQISRRGRTILVEFQ
jgi:hypothetical protein